MPFFSDEENTAYIDSGSLTILELNHLASHRGRTILRRLKVVHLDLCKRCIKVIYICRHVSMGEQDYINVKLLVARCKHSGSTYGSWNETKSRSILASGSLYEAETTTSE